MQDFKQYVNEKTIIQSRGFLGVRIGSSEVKISFNGNMMNRLADVEKEFDALYFKGAFKKIQNSPAAREKGTPDNSYSLVISKKEFLKAVGKINEMRGQHYPLWSDPKKMTMGGLDDLKADPKDTTKKIDMITADLEKQRKKFASSKTISTELQRQIDKWERVKKYINEMQDVSSMSTPELVAFVTMADTLKTDSPEIAAARAELAIRPDNDTTFIEDVNESQVGEIKKLMNKSKSTSKNYIIHHNKGYEKLTGNANDAIKIAKGYITTGGWNWKYRGKDRELAAKLDKTGQVDITYGFSHIQILLKESFPKVKTFGNRFDTMSIKTLKKFISDAEDEVTTPAHGQIVKMARKELLKRSKNKPYSPNESNWSKNRHGTYTNKHTGVTNSAPKSSPVTNDTEDALAYYVAELKRLKSNPDSYKTHIQHAEKMAKRYKKKLGIKDENVLSVSDIKTWSDKRLAAYYHQNSKSRSANIFVSFVANELDKRGYFKGKEYLRERVTFPRRAKAEVDVNKLIAKEFGDDWEDDFDGSNTYVDFKRGKLRGEIIATAHFLKLDSRSGFKRKYSLVGDKITKL